jgi:hypothetical protein
LDYLSSSLQKAYYAIDRGIAEQKMSHETSQEESSALLSIVTNKSLKEIREAPNLSGTPINNEKSSLGGSVVELQTNPGISSNVMEKNQTEARNALVETESRKAVSQSHSDNPPPSSTINTPETLSHNVQGAQQNPHSTTYIQQPNIATALQNAAFHGTYQTLPPEIYDPLCIPRNLEDFNNLRAQQQPSRLLEKISVENSKNTNNFTIPSEERYNLMIERDVRWGEVKNEH